jgi:hypothetical protein
MFEAQTNHMGLGRANLTQHTVKKGIDFGRLVIDSARLASLKGSQIGAQEQGISRRKKLRFFVSN